MILFLIFIFGTYFFCLILLLIGFNRLPIVSIEAPSPKTKFSIVIPFRNEAENLPNLLESLFKLKYPTSHFEVLLINDASEDDSEESIKKFLSASEITITVFQNIRKSNSPKKDALTLGIERAKNDWIITTDADCEVPEKWLLWYDSLIQKFTPKMICGPVLYDSNGKFIEDFQQLDGLSLQTVTMGGFGHMYPLMANGANLGFQKKAFFEVGGFLGNDHLASGDDIFLMEKMKRKFPKQLKFLKTSEAFIRTKPQKTFKSLCNQRIRWASKTAKQKNSFSFLLGILVFSTNFLLILIPFFYFWNPNSLLIFSLGILLKFIFDFIFVRRSAKLFGIRIKFTSFFISFSLYPVLILWIVIKSLKGNFSWKGRQFQYQN